MQTLLVLIQGPSLPAEAVINIKNLLTKEYGCTHVEVSQDDFHNFSGNTEYKVSEETKLEENLIEIKKRLGSVSGDFLKSLKFIKTINAYDTSSIMTCIERVICSTLRKSQKEVLYKKYGINKRLFEYFNSYE